MLYREIIAVCSEIHTEHTNTLCGQNVDFCTSNLVVHIVTAGHLAVNSVVKQTTQSNRSGHTVSRAHQSNLISNYSYEKSPNPHSRQPLRLKSAVVLSDRKACTLTAVCRGTECTWCDVLSATAQQRWKGFSSSHGVLMAAPDKVVHPAHSGRCAIRKPRSRCINTASRTAPSMSFATASLKCPRSWKLLPRAIRMPGSSSQIDR